MKLTSTAVILNFDPFTVDTASSTHNLGEQIILADNRRFSYGKASTTSTAGKLQSAPTPIANHANMSVTATATGLTQLTVTPGATAGSANIYAEGYAIINEGATSQGRVYQVKGHPAITSSTAFVLDLFDPLATALSATDNVTLVHNAYNAFLEGTSATVRAAGVPLVSFAANNFGWLQTKGVASVLNGATITLGAQLINSGATAGAVVDATDVTAPQAEVIVGAASIMAGVSTEYRPMFLNIG